MYLLTLTQDERRAFDMLGNRYNCEAICFLLIDCIIDDDVAWCDEGDVDFYIPEYIMWEINELAQEEEYQFPCFGGELRSKLTQLCLSVV